jgi:hypothetical protein
MAPKIEEVSVAEFSAMCGVTPQRVYQWIQEGMPHRKRKKGDTRVVAREGIKWLIDRAVAEAKKGQGLDEDVEKIRRMRAEAGLKELELKERAGELVPQKEWGAFIDAFTGGLSAASGGELQRFEREIIRASNAGEARALTTKIRTAMMVAAQRFADQLTEEADDMERTSTPKRDQKPAA